MRLRNRTIERLWLVAIIGLIACFAVLANSVETRAQVTQLLGFMGKVTNTNGTEVADGNYDFSFSLYDAATGGTQLWTEDLTAATRFAGTIASYDSNTNKYTYSGATATSTLRLGQYLTNADTGESALIVDYDTSAETITVASSSPTWSAGQAINNRPYVEGGVIDINLGSVTSISGVDFDQPLYLEIVFNGETMQPRKIIVPVEQAMNADKLDGYDASDFANASANTVVTGEWTFNNVLSIATSSATTALTITQSGTGDVVNIFDGANEVFTILDGGNIGIGTSTPTNKLDVYGDIGIRNQNELRLYELALNGSNYVGFRASSTLSTDLVWTLPTTQGSSGQALLLNANGDLEWGAAGSGAVNSGLTGQISYYVSDGDTLSGTSSIFLTPAGNFAIGTTSADNLFTVGGTSGSQFIVNSSSYVGIGTTTLSSKLSIQGTSGLPALNIASSTGASMLYVDEYGRVGLGTSAPTAKLTIANNLATGFLDNYSEYQIVLYDNVATAETYGLGVKSGSLVFNSGAGGYSFDAGGNVTRMAINSAGNVSIGTTSADNLFTVGGTSGSQFIVNSSGYVGIGTTSPLTRLSVQGVAGLPILNIASSSGSSLFYIDGQGQIGIGTTTPDSQLVISGTSGPQLKLNYGGTAHEASFTMDSDGLFTIESSEPGDVYIDPSSKFGIGTSSPTAELTIYGDALFEGTSRGVYFGTTTGPSSYGFRSNAGTLEFRHLGSDWTQVSIVQSGYQGWIPYYGGTTVDLTATSTIFITPNGLVGIGSTSPSQALTVEGNVALSNGGISGISYLDINNVYGYGLRFAGTSTRSITWGNDSTHQFGGVSISSVKINTGPLNSGTGVSFGPYNSEPTAALNANGTMTLNGYLYVGGERLSLTASNRASSSILVENSQNIPFLEFASSSGEVYIYVDETGRLGLNTSSPDVILHVGSTTPTIVSGAEDAFFAGAVELASGAYITNQNGLRLYEASGNGTEYINLTATSSIGSSITYTLPTPGTAGQALLLGNDNHLYWGTAGSGSGDVGSGTTGQLPYYSSDGTSVTATSSIFLDSTGYIGLGTTTPQTELEVVGSIAIANQNGLRLYEANADGMNYISLTATSSVASNITYTLPTPGTAGQALLLGNDNHLYWGTAGSGSGDVGSGTIGQLPYYSSDGTSVTATSSIFLDSTGYIGLGTTSPESKLFVDGDIQLTGNLLSYASTSIGTPVTRIKIGYFDSIDVLDGVVAPASANGTDSNSFTINTDNATADTEDATLAFERGSVTPNATLTWDSTNDRFAMNQPLYLESNNFLTLGSIGIGTTTMDNKLDVYGDIGIRNQNGLRLYELVANGGNYVEFTATSSLTSNTTYTWPGAGSSGQVLTLGAGNNLYWADAGSGGVGSGTTGQFPYYASTGTSVTATSSIYLAASGNVGIGNSSPGAYQLNVSGNTYVDSGNLYLDSNYAVGNTGLTAYLLLGTDNANLLGSSYLSFTTGGSESMRINSSGYVGIGTTTPQDILAVAGDIGITNQNGLKLYELEANGYNSISLKATSSVASNITYTLPASGTPGQALLLGNNNHLYWGTAGSGSGTVNSGTTGQFPYYAADGTTVTATSSLFIDTAGRLGIGTSMPSHLFDVYGNQTDYLAKLYNVNTTASSSGLSIRSDGAGTLLNLNSNGTDIVTVTANQTLFNNPVSFGAAGDVSIAYDLYFTNDTAAYINFNGPGYIRTDSVWQNLDLTLMAANSGQVIVDDELVVTGGATTSLPLLIDSETSATSTPSDGLFMIKSDVNTNENIVFKIDAGGNVTRDGTDTTPAADYAEYYFTYDTDLKSGEAVCVDVTRENAVKRCERASDGNVMGIVSTRPAIIGNAKSNYINNAHYVIVGMLGQVPAKVSTENGPIRPGDSLTSASKPGYVMKAGDGDPTVGVALQAFGSASATFEEEIVDLETGTSTPELASTTPELASSSPELASTTPPVEEEEEVETLVLETGEINVLISRRNKSLTVETVEARITDRIAEMEIEDEVEILIANAVNTLDLGTEIQPIVDEQIALFDERLTAEFDSVSGQLTTIAASTDSLLARMSLAESGIISLSQAQISIQSALANINEQLILLGASSISELKKITVNKDDGLVITNDLYYDPNEPTVSVVEITTATTTQKIAFVVNQLGDGDVVDFQADGVSIVNIANSGKVSVVGEMTVDGRIMVCAGSGCGNALDAAVDETMGDMGVEGKVVAGAFESVCADGFVWVPGSAKYGTMPGFCVMASEARIGADNIPTIDLEIDGFASSLWNNVSQGEAQLACQTMGDNYHLISENEWLTLAENIIRVNDNDIDPEKPGLQLATSSIEVASGTSFVLSNGNKIYGLAGGLSEWSDMIVTKAGLIEPTSNAWQEYYEIVDFKGFNIAPPYYYDSRNGIGRIKVDDNDYGLRGFVRGLSSLYDLDLSYPPTTATSTIGFRCAK